MNALKQYIHKLAKCYIEVKFNPFQLSFVFHIITIRWIYTAKQKIGFYMKCNFELKRVKHFVLITETLLDYETCTKV